jgi:hypothetical protein
LSTPIGRIDLEVSCETRENKYREMLMFEVVSFNIGYNYILRRTFLLKFMAVIHTAYVTIKIPGHRGVITLKLDQRDALACENASLTHTEKFGEKEAQNLTAKVAKTHRGGTPARMVTLGPLAGNTPKTPAMKKSTTVTPTSTQHATDQLVADERKGAADKEIQVDPSDADKKLRISMELEAKWELVLITFLWANLNVFPCQISDMPGIPREMIEYKLGINPAFKPIKQKERRYTLERREII